MNCEAKEMTLGERRRITMEVWLNDGSTFTPKDPAWELSCGGVVEDSGTCETAQADKRWCLTAEVQPKKPGSHRLRYTFGLGTEIIIRSVTLRVGK